MQLLSCLCLADRVPSAKSMLILKMLPYRSGLPLPSYEYPSRAFGSRLLQALE